MNVGGIQTLLRLKVNWNVLREKILDSAIRAPPVDRVTLVKFFSGQPRHIPLASFQFIPYKQAQRYFHEILGAEQTRSFDCFSRSDVGIHMFPFTPASDAYNRLLAGPSE